MGPALTLEEMDQAVQNYVAGLDDATRSKASDSFSQGEAA